MIAALLTTLLVVAVLTPLVLGLDMFRPVEGYEDEFGFHEGKDPRDVGVGGAVISVSFRHEETPVDVGHEASYPY